jgi:CRP-like cAMP-binding protein
MFPASIFFEHLSKDDVALLANVEEHHYLADATIIREGEQPGQVFLLVDGLASVYIDGPAGERRELARLGAGELIGDVSWLDRIAASASVRTLENTLVVSIATEALEELIAGHAGLAGRFLRAVAALNASRVRR